MEPPKSITQFRDRWAKRESRLSPDGSEAWLNWAVRRIDVGVYVGKLDAEVNLEKVATNVGYVFFPEFWGHGYATESIIALVDHFSRNGITKAYATVTTGNKPSERVLEKAGFVKNRIIPEGDLIRGMKYDEMEYVRLLTHA